MPHTNPRALAVEVLHTAAIERRFVESVLNEQLAASGLPAADRALATEIAYGATRRRLTLDWVVEHYSHLPLGKVHPRLRLILQVALYQLLFMHKVPDYAAVNEAVELAKREVHAGAARFANALLRAVRRAGSRLPYPPEEQDLVEHLAVVHSHPRWLVRRWLNAFGRDKTAAICAANNQPPATTLRANSLRVSRDELVEHLRCQGVEAEPVGGHSLAVRIRAPRPLDTLHAYARGEFYVQDVAAMRVASLLDPQPGERVLDLCAAPGGKTSHCAELMGDRGRIVACDLDENRLETLRANVARLGITIVETARCDARHVPELLPVALFDRVLLDVPCSNTGVLRRRAEARWRVKEEDLPELCARQGELLDTAARMVADGGVLVYSTCSIEQEENEEVVRGFLSRHGELRLDSETTLLPDTEGSDGGYMARMRRAN